MEIEKIYDVVLYGATGFTGKQTVAYFLEYAPSHLKWAIAGRNRQKLEQVKSELGSRANQIDVITADSQNSAQVDAMVKNTRVLLTTVGPYDTYGRLLVDACVRFQTDYVDITGETPFVKYLIDTYHETAKVKGIKIIPMCGFDSVPSDIGTFVVAKYIKESLKQQCLEVKSFFQVFGGFNGGTLNTALTLTEEEQIEQFLDPIVLNPEQQKTESERDRSRDQVLPKFDTDLWLWVAPFFMAPINTRVVRRSNALLSEEGKEYNKNFTYHEYLAPIPGISFIQAAGILAATSIGMNITQNPAIRDVIQKVLPAPGEGPSEFLMDNGFFEAKFIATTSDGKKIKAIVKDKGDPNNRVTVKCLCESALALVLQRKELPGGEKKGGILTPATGLGDVLVTRLKNAGMRIEVVP
ncbi:MAG: saccharopine dehydrogenase NADP-binding domain-containing protein [Spirochaetota bacterium]